MRTEKVRTTYGDYLAAVGKRPERKTPSSVVTFKRGGRAHDTSTTYVCAVWPRPYTEPSLREAADKRRIARALAFGEFMYPAAQRGRLNLQPLADRIAAAYIAERPARHLYPDDPRREQRAARKVRNARKRRRGWA